MSRRSSTVPTRRSSRRFSQATVPFPVYLGVDIEISDSYLSTYSISVHDGSYTTEYYQGELVQHEPTSNRGEMLREAFKKLEETVHLYSIAQNYKVQLVACSYDLAKEAAASDDLASYEEMSVMSSYWTELDALPFRIETHGATTDERASAAVRKAVMWMSPQYPGNLPRISVGYRHEASDFDKNGVAWFDFNHQIHMVNLIDYQKTVCQETWDVFQQMCKTFRDRNLRVSFFNSTPQGGGVALMRHALLRLLHLNNVDVHWFVSRPKPEVFNITKRKFHNVLQGVSPPDVRLTEEDKQIFIAWSDENANRFWLDEKGPIKNSDVIVIDDPQVVGIIPHIRKHAPNTRIIFRSHIEIRADLIRDYPHGPQAETWNFLWQFIKQADLFIAHPINNFIPDCVPRRSVVLLPAATDPIDGLNKELSQWCVTYYRSVFNRVCIDLGANEVDWFRPYIIQVARFDPSKGIPDVLETYRLLRLKMEGHFEHFDIPQLVICGHGSIDDPDGTVIYEQVCEILQKPEYSVISADVIAVRLPASDQVLNMILRGAHVALQLSHREGFEVKVTEALHKGVPVVAYRAGGIPLQIKENESGFLIEIGDIQGVCDKLYELFSDKELHARTHTKAKESVSEEYFTVWNSMSWLHMFLELTGDVNVSATREGLSDYAILENTNLGNERKVSELWRERYNYKV